MYALTTRNRMGNVFDFVDRVLRQMPEDATLPSALAPYAVDVHEDQDHYFIVAELPGFAQNEIDLTLEDGVLTIRAERKVDNTSKRGEPLHVERRWTTFQRSFTLPAAVNESAVQAHLDNGLLHITLNKREEVKPRKIAVTAGPGNTNGNGSAVKAAS